MGYKVAFLSWHFATPEIFLQSILKMTPGRSGKWGNIEAITDPMKADFCFVMDGYNGKLPEERTIYFGEHPSCCETSYRTWQDKKALARLTLDKHVNLGEWWLEYDYDYLIALEPPKKSRNLICIMTYQTHNEMYAQRPKFVRELVTRYPQFYFDLYGRPQERFESDTVLKCVYRGALGYNNPDGRIGQHLVGKEILQAYKYSLEFDVGPTKNYFSERFYDALLLWTCPIYFGSTNVSKYIPGSAFWTIDINHLNSVEKIPLIVEEEPDIESIRIARELLLNRYQMWPYAHHIINHLDLYI